MTFGVRELEYRLRYSEACRRQISALHPDLKSVVRSRLDSIRSKPYSGKRLERELAGYRSFRANRFRIIYRIDEETNTLEIHYVGHRKDVYELFGGHAYKGRRGRP